jgi:hypothetical protein
MLHAQNAEQMKNIFPVITEVVKMLHAQNAEQMKNMMTMFQLLLTAKQLMVTVVPPTNKQTNKQTNKRSRNKQTNKERTNKQTNEQG